MYRCEYTQLRQRSGGILNEKLRVVTSDESQLVCDLFANVIAEYCC